MKRDPTIAPWTIVSPGHRMQVSEVAMSVAEFIWSCECGLKMHCKGDRVLTSVVKGHLRSIGVLPPRSRNRRGSYASRVDNMRRSARRKLGDIIGLRGGLCHWCGEEMTAQDCTVEHLIPLSEGGTNDMANLSVAHRKCNNDRHARPKKTEPEAWRIDDD